MTTGDFFTRCVSTYGDTFCMSKTLIFQSGGDCVQVHVSRDSSSKQFKQILYSILLYCTYSKLSKIEKVVFVCVVSDSAMSVIIANTSSKSEIFAAK